MSSNSKYHLLISNSCSNGTIGTFFDSSHQDKYSILQKMVADASLNKGRGIIAAFGAAGFSGQYWLDDGYDDYFHYASSAIIDSAFNTYGLVYRGSIKVLTAGGNEDEMGQNGFRASFQFVGDPSTSIRYTNPTSETAPNSYLAVSSSSVTVYTGGAVGDVRISAYAPNTEYFSTTTKTGNTNHTFSTSVRPLFVAITKDDASKIPSVWTSGGTLTIDTGIIGKLKINGDLTIQSGKTLSIYPDAELTFRASNDDQAGGYNTSKAELIINGTLSANNATFKSSTGVSGTWQGIYFEDGCSSSSEMKGCTIEDGYYGVVIKEDITIDSCDIYDIDYTAIKVSNSAEPIITDSKIRAGTFGIYLYDGSGTILRNDFIGPFDDISSGTGIYALGSDYTDVDYCDFTFSSTTTQQTYNKNGTTLDLYCCNMDVPGTGKYYMKEVSSGDANIGYSYMGCPADEIDDNNFYGDVSYFQMSDNPIGTAGATWKKQVGDDYIYALERMNHKDYSSAFLLLKKLINSPSVENKAQCFNLAMQAAKKMNILFDQTSYIQEIQNENLELNEILKVW
ncbi:MAG: right-handed parallel beta-helix repeat-containing protein, partial [Marinilabiliaceae bacterium]|nr:right-handed parallel beta-helix repeat-containing protein [Marinilabiliaceae bacterium]